LRRYLCAGTAVLRLSSRGCICAAATKVAEVRRQGALPAARQPSLNRADDMLRTLSGKSAAAAGEGLILAADRRSPRTVNDTLTVAAPAAQIGEDAAAAGT
jgi:hypothetical protein